MFIEDYQRRHPVDMPEVTPLAMLKHLMEQHDINVTELGRIIGSQSNASLILSGKRAISKRVMGLLSDPSACARRVPLTKTHGQRPFFSSTKPPVDPSFKDQHQQAWTQPVGWQERLKEAD